MEPFRVTCETCRVRLRVNDPAIVGQIHACPKCDSMVHLVPPAETPTETLASAPAKLSGAAAVGESVVIASPTVFDDIPNVETAPATAQSLPTVDTIGSASETAGKVLPSESLAEVAAAFDEIVSNSSQVTEATTEAAAEVAEKVPFLQSQLAIGLASFAGVLAIGGLVGLMLWGGTEPERPVEASILPPVEIVAARQPLPAESADAPAQEVADDELPVPEPIAAAAEMVPNTIPEAIPAADPIVAEAPVQEAVFKKEPRRRPLDLLSFDPAHLELAVGSPAPVASFEPVPPSPVPMATAVSERPVSGRQTPESQANAADAIANVEPEPSLPNNQLADATAPIRLGPPSVVIGQALSVATLLKTPVASIDMPAARLHRWLEMMADLTAVPITLDPGALVVAGLAADEPMVIRASRTTAGELLEAVLSKHRLAMVERGNQLVVTSVSKGRHRTSNYNARQLMGPRDADASEVAAAIGQLVNPSSWETSGGVGRMEVDGPTIRVQHDSKTHLEVLVLLERMLLARDLPTKSKYPARLLSIEPTYTQLKPALDRSATFTFTSWTPLAEVIRYWQDASGLNVLVDWAALGEVALGPTSLVVCSVADVPWHEALDTLLLPLGLTWRAVDARTLQITTIEEAERLRTVEFYPVADLVRSEAGGASVLVATLKARLSGQLGQSTADDCQFVIDAGSGYLLVRANAGIHRVLAAHLAAL